MLATVNPCGFALLPAYLSAFVGLDDSENKTSAVTRALSVSAVLTAGFITVFGLFGVIVVPLSLRIEEYLPWATVVIGIGLTIMGILLLRGKQFVVRIPKLQKGGADGTLPSMFMFGISYAVASLSCTIGPFLAVTSTTFRNETYLSGVTIFVLYGIGMGIVVAVLTMAVALAKDGLVAKFRSLVPKMNKIAGGLLVVAGLYVAYYGYYEVRLFNGSIDGEDPIIDVAIDVRERIVQYFPDTGEVWKYAVAMGVLIAAGVWWSLWSRGAKPDAEDGLSVRRPSPDLLGGAASEFPTETSTDLAGSVGVDEPELVPEVAQGP
jgi:cytochrome c-type biogenesis protein